MTTRFNWSTAGHLLAAVLLLASSAAFVSGGVMAPFGVAGTVFVVLGGIGLVFFGFGVLSATGRLFGLRAVLELDPDGIRRPAAWPLPRRADRVLPWDELSGLCALARGVGKRGTARNYLVFLPGAETVEAVRDAGRPELVALTLPETALGARTAPWCFAVEPAWTASLTEIVKATRERREVPFLDRRKN
ncbi:hypothetical protein DPM19_16175 [Actinomadura craniellae]|uniref:Uncharacterized protein n=1 Tax=Actinomadura craniellae TaxID=2231787 RepID=A0A365H5Y7_9ACTN|nr:hypothetical protein DPM19_16175 [Actinomadura craniellae]